MAWFSRQKPGVEESSSEGEKRVRTEGLWLKCESCTQVIWKKAPRSAAKSGERGGFAVNRGLTMERTTRAVEFVASHAMNFLNST